MGNDTNARFLRLPEVEERVGLRHTQIHKLEAQGNFPRRIKISVRASGWLEAEVNAWIDEKVAASRAGQQVITGRSIGPRRS